MLNLTPFKKVMIRIFGEVGFLSPIFLIPLFINFGGGSIQLSVWSVIVMLSALGYGRLFAASKNEPSVPHIHLVLGLVVMVLIFVVLALLGATQVSSTAVIGCGLIALVVRSYMNHLRFSNQSASINNVQTSLLCLSGSALLLVDHSPAWGFPLAVCVAGAILSLIPNRVLQLLTLLTILVLLGFRVGAPDSGFFLVSDDISFTEAFSYLTIRYGPHEWYGVLGIAAPYHWFGFGLLGLFGLGSTADDLYPTALLSQVVICSLFPGVIKDLIELQRPRSKWNHGLIVVILLAAPFSYQFSPSTTFSALLFAVVLAYIFYFECASKIPRSLVGLFLLVFAMTSSKATIMISGLLLVAAITRLRVSQGMKLKIAGTLTAGFLASLIFTYDILDVWSFEEYGLNVSILASGDPWQLGMVFSLVTVLVVGLVGSDFRFGVCAATTSIFAFYVFSATSTPQSHYFVWTMLWTTLITLAVPLSRLAPREFLAILGCSTAVILSVRTGTGSWTPYRWSGRFPNLPPDVPAWLFVMTFTAVMYAIGLRTIFRRRDRLSRNQNGFFGGGVIAATLLVIVAWGQASLLVDRWQLLGSEFTTEIDMETPRRLRGNLSLREAARWIRENTNRDAIIASNYVCDISSNDAVCDLDGESPVAALTRRRTLLEAPRFAAGLLEEPPLNNRSEVSYPNDILSDYRIVLLLAADDARDPMELLRERGVTHYLEQVGGTGNLTQLRGVQLFVNSEFRVIQVNES